MSKPRKRTIQEYDRVFNDIMGYAERNIGDPRYSEETLNDYIERYDVDGKFVPEFFRKIEDTPSYQRKLRDFTDKGEALRFELARSQQARRVDESRTAKTKLHLTRENLTRWKANPGRLDLLGVDTKTHALLRRELTLRARKAIIAGYKVGRKGGLLYRIEGQKRRDLLTGQYISKPEVKRA